MSASSARLRRRAGKIAAAVIVVTFHALLLLSFNQGVRPPTTRGDGSSDTVAMTLALAPASSLEDPRSQGADTQTLAATATVAEAPVSDKAEQAQGAGTTPVVDPGGVHVDVSAQVASTSRAGGGGGDKDDPWARASLAPMQASASSSFALPASNDVLFRAHVQPCLKGEAAALGPVSIAVILSPDGAVQAAEPVRPAAPPGARAPAPTLDEARAIAAIRACAPYGDPSPGRFPILRLPATTRAETSSAERPRGAG